MILSKYCASGNDFLIFHSFEEKNYSKMAVELCNRFYGIGADGLVVVLPYMSNPEHRDSQKNFTDQSLLVDKNCEIPYFYETIAYKWDFYNSDGSMANMCGNASRAVGLYAYHNSLASLKHNFLSKSGIIAVQIQEVIHEKKAFVQSNIGKFSFEGNFIEDKKGNMYEFELINMCIPHLVCHVDSIRSFNSLCMDLEFLAKLRHKYNANINIAFRDNNIVHYATFERGVEGITQACGTGACAVYVSYRDFAQKYVLIPPSRERLSVSCVNETVYFAGLVHKVCDCII